MGFGGLSWKGVLLDSVLITLVDFLKQACSTKRFVFCRIKRLPSILLVRSPGALGYD